MKNFVKILVCLFVGTLLFTSCSKENDAVDSYDQVAAQKVDYDYIPMEVKILEQINIYRAVKGLNELKPLDEISIAAEGHNLYMIETANVCHDNFNLRAEALKENINARSISENVAYGYGSARTVVNAWLKSKKHRENIEKNLTHFGISVRQDAEGKNYFTNILIRK